MKVAAAQAAVLIGGLLRTSLNLLRPAVHRYCRQWTSSLRSGRIKRFRISQGELRVKGLTIGEFKIHPA